MDDLLAALLCLPFIIAPAITLIIIILSKIQASYPWPCRVRCFVESLLF